MTPVRRLLSLPAILILVAGCAGTEPSPSATATAFATPGSAVRTSTPSMGPAATEPRLTAAPTSTPVPTSEPTHQAARWERAGTMEWARRDPTAVRLGDGRVLVLGDTGGKYEAVPEHSRNAELWDPATGTWRNADALPKARGSFAAVTLDDGRALIAGGVNDTWYSYSSAYVFDPITERWTKVGLMGTARTDPAAAVLPDGRVLVAGGMYHTGVREEATASGGVVLAGVRLADTWPGPEGHALATAELFDPTTGTWSPTGSMRYARAGAAVASLADGRVLIAGAPWIDRADGTAEIYDPATGRFSLTESLPGAVDPSLFAQLGVPASDRCTRADPVGAGTLMALDDGDAILVDSDWGCSTTNVPSVDLTLTRTFRLTAKTGRWVETGLTTVLAGHEADGMWVQQRWGSGHLEAIVVPLPDGHILFAGGNGDDQLGIRTADLLDPMTGRWSSLPRMPAARMSAEGIVLADGSALIVGGYSDPSDGYPVALDEAFRFVPGS